MRDLELFRRLLDGSVGPESVEDIRAMAGWPLERRLAWLGVLRPALRSEHAALRAAAVQALGGAAGMEALEAIVAGLDDEEPDVRRCAVVALGASVLPGQSWRMVHALLHSRVDVRQQALTSSLPGELDGLVFCLLADPACHAALVQRGLRPAGSRQLYAFMQAGLLSPEAARPLLAGLGLEELEPWLHGQPQRDLECIDRLLLGGPPEGSDAIDGWLGALWGPGEDGARGLQRAADLLLSAPGKAYHSRAVASALALSEQGRNLAPDGAVLCAVLFPPCILHEAWDEAAVRAAIVGLRRHRSRLPTLADGVLAPVISSPRLRLPDGTLDLEATVAVLYAAEEPLALLAARLDLDESAEAFRRDARTAATLFTLRDSSRFGHRRLLAALRARCPAVLPAAVAWALVHRDAGALEPLQALDKVDLIPLLEALLHIMGAGEPRLAGKRLERIAQKIGHRLVPGLRVRRLPLLGLTPDPRHALAFLRLLVAQGGEASPGWDLLQRVLGAVCRALRPDGLALCVAALPEDIAIAALQALDAATTVSGVEREGIARLLAGQAVPALRTWGMMTLAGPPSPPVAVQRDTVTLSPAERQDLLDCREADLEAVLRRWLGVPTRGLTEALARRPGDPEPSVIACAALLGSVDSARLVAEQIERYRGDDAAWWRELDGLVVRHWEPFERLPALAHAWLWRWDRHALCFTERAVSWGLTKHLETALALPSIAARDVVFTCLARGFSLWRLREPERLRNLDHGSLVMLLVPLLDTELGYPAARMIAAMHRAEADPGLFAGLLSSLEQLAPSLTEACRHELRELVDCEGVVAPVRPPRALVRTPPSFLVERVQASEDPDWLASCCGHREWGVGSEAALRLVALEEPGQARLAEVLLGEPRPPAFEDLAESLGLWSEGPALQGVRDALTGLDAERRFRLAIALAERGDAHLTITCLEAASEPGPSGWFQQSDHSRLVALCGDELTVARALIHSPHPHANVPAATRLLEHPSIAEVAPELVRFLELDHQRLRSLRLLAARRLAEQGDHRGFPLLLPRMVSDEPVHKGWVLHDQSLLDAATGAVLAAGGALERQLVSRLARGVPTGIHVDWGRLLRKLLDDNARRIAANQASLAVMARRLAKLDAVAEAFAWGQWRSLELLGRRLSVHMTSGHRELGHTRLSGSSIHVSPLPLLRGERRGREVVEGLILHELGHHRYHAGRAGRRMWKAAQEEGIHPLLNLVADEHLERNLRAYEGSYGDRFKALASYAFQHSTRDLEVEELVEALHLQAFAVLVRTRLQLGWKPDCVRIGSGQLLRALERGGDSFARFMRALRMGLGDRHGDPKVAEALDLFGGRFRDSQPDALLGIARELRRIFGGSSDLAGMLGGHEGLTGERREQDVFGDSISDGEVQREVRRILRPPRKRGDGAQRGRVGPAVLNVGEDERFRPIKHVQPSKYDPAARRALGAQVARHARRMRGYLEELGLRLEAQGGRLRGSRFDRTRARAVVTHGDPRILVARERVHATDLFLGIAVDCSGSMASERSMDKAKLFASLLADAARGLRGVDLRIIGFTDTTIYDAGDAERCAVASLPIEGGNNDAAGLAHLAELAFASHRRARLLVMISDGLPTECSTTALAALVRSLERRGLCVAQVAVKPLHERCFTHYIELDEANVDVAVRSFGTIIARLVRRALRT